MSSTPRQNLRKTQAPASLLSAPSRSTSLTPGTYTALSVEEWEAKAPLSDIETRSVNAIKTASEKVPYPLKFTREDDDDEVLSAEHESLSSRSATPVQFRRGISSSRPSTPSSGPLGHRSTPSTSKTAAALHPRQPVNTTQQLYDWFALVDRSVAHSQEAHFRAHVASVAEYLDMCDVLLDRVEEIEREVERMMECWWSVEEGGRSLKDACERVLEERDKLIELTDDIGAHLEYFQELDHATRMLNHPGEQLIYQPDFLDMVEKVDICIDFLRARRHYKESEVYLLRFQQCLTRAMTLVRMNFVSSIRSMSADVSKRMADSSATLSETAAMHLLYTRFRTMSLKLAPLLGELERRAKKYPDELGSLLAECHSAYFSVRKALLVPKVLEEIRGLDPSRSELVELTRTGCSYLKQLCTDEFNLYRSFFSTAEDQLYQYLETLCDLLYDDLRPRILHEPRLTALCEVCTVLQALMVLDAPIASSNSVTSTLFSTDDNRGRDPSRGSDGSEDSGDDDMSDDELNIDFDHPGREKSRNGAVGKRLHTRQLLQMVLQDAQTRLFFKAQSVIQSEIRYYVPKKEDLAWPDVILDANRPRGVTDLREKESISKIFDKDGDGVGSLMKRQDMWYPSLKKMVWVLEQLHDFVKPAIFEDIAQEAALLCRQSLFAAADMIKARPPPSTKLDGSLFLVRHLLILKEVARRVGLSTAGSTVDSATGKVGGPGGMLSPGRVEEFRTGSSPSGVTGTLTTMLNRTTAILPEGLFASLGVPRADENLRDVKHGLDDDLRKACEEVINSCVNPLCEPLDEWVVKVHAYSRGGRGNFTSGGRRVPPTSAAAPPPLSSTADAATWATPTRIRELYEQYRLQCERDLRANAARIRLYLGEQAVVDQSSGYDAPGSSRAGASTPTQSNSGALGTNAKTNQAGSGRTARVLIEHVRERVWEGYRGFLEGVKELSLAAAVSSGSGSGHGQSEQEREREWRSVVREMEDESAMRDVLGRVCGL